MKHTDNTAQTEIVTALRERVQRIEGGKRPRGDLLVSTGCDGLDRLFPENGIRRGSLVEWHGNGRGHGAGSLALVAARQACSDGKALVVIDRAGTFYAHAAAALGIDLNGAPETEPVAFATPLAEAIYHGQIGKLKPEVADEIAAILREAGASE